MLNSPFNNKTDPSVATTCQCEGCNNPVSTKTNTTGKYCSLSCGAKQAAALRKQAKIDQYALLPKPCAHCKKPIPYEKRNENKFCSSSCAASHNNSLRDYSVFKPGPAPKPPKTKEQKKQERLNRQKPKQCVVCGKQHVRQGKTCSDECCSAILSENAKNRGLGGNKNTRAHGWYQSPTAGRVWLESSYEYRVAKDLDDIGIAWTRPEYMPYVLNNQSKKYYADFYLVDQDVYLDPKNDFLIIQDKSKIEAVSEQNHVKILILNKHQLSWSCIKQIIENYQC